MVEANSDLIPIDSIRIIAGFHDNSALYSQIANLQIEDVVTSIINLNQDLCDFWSHAYGWAFVEATHLLSKSRLDWQVSLSKCLRLWLQATPDDVEDGHLILAWANLGTLIEGTLKLYLSVWYRDYKKDAVIRKGKLIGPDDLQLEMLRQIFYKNRLWDNGWDAWAKKVQQRRNSIHAYKNRDIGTFQEYYSDLRRYLEFLWQIDAVLPYPDEYLRPYMLPYLI